MSSRQSACELPCGLLWMFCCSDLAGQDFGIPVHLVEIHACPANRDVVAILLNNVLRVVDADLPVDSEVRKAGAGGICNFIHGDEVGTNLQVFQLHWVLL